MGFEMEVLPIESDVRLDVLDEERQRIALNWDHISVVAPGVTERPGCRESDPVTPTRRHAIPAGDRVRRAVKDDTDLNDEDKDRREYRARGVLHERASEAR